MKNVMTDEILGEIRQTAAWWDAEYNRLCREAFPPKAFDPAEHIGHDVSVFCGFGGLIRTTCITCATTEAPA